MKQQLKVALLQISPPEHGNLQQEAQAKGALYCIKAAEEGADIILFPELWNIGYRFPDTTDPPALHRWKQQAVARKSEFVRSFQRLAKSLHVAIAITYLENCGEDKPRNSVTVFDRNGHECLHYSKVHTCDFGVEIITSPGDQFKVATLDTAVGSVQIGAMICFDREQPESARVLMLKGAEIIIVPNASNLGRAQLEQFSARAFENMVGVAMANYPAPKNNGRSVAYSPITEDRNRKEHDNCLELAGDGEGISYAAFNIDQIRTWRKSHIWGNAYRQPAAYRDLTSKTTKHPFIRKIIR